MELPHQLYLKFFKNLGMPLLVFRELWQSIKGWFEDGPLMKESPQQTFQRLLNDPGWKQILNSKWSLEKLMVNPSDFAQNDQDLFKERKFGQKELGWVPNDLTRTARAKQIINRQLPGENQPVIITKYGPKYNLVEGWHRGMNILLQGKPDDPRLAVDFRNWKRVPVQAWLGTPGIASSISYVM